VVDHHGGRDWWEVDLDVAGEPFILALSDTEHDGWTLRGLPAGASALSVTVDGFRQGRIVEGVDPGPLTVVVEFGPARLARFSVGASLVTGLLLLTGTLRSWRRSGDPAAMRTKRLP
jgi:hypothetical protein